jgi:hypothetical protein
MRLSKKSKMRVLGFFDSQDRSVDNFYFQNGFLDGSRGVGRGETQYVGCDPEVWPSS